MEVWTETWNESHYITKP